jgi:hypothetical protein
VTTVPEEIVLTSHPCVTWPGAVNLHTGKDGWLLTITRNPLRDAATRLLEEGYDPASVLIIRDSFDAVPELRSNSLTEAAKPEATKP